MVTTHRPAVEQGDIIELTGRRVGDAARVGEILDVLGHPDHPHYLVRWEDGHESVFFPGGDSRIRKAPVLPEPRPRPALDLAAASGLLAEALRRAGIEFELMPHRRTSTASSEARVLGVLPQTVAKTLIAKNEEGAYVRAVVPASTRLDLKKLAEAMDARAMVLLTEQELVSAYPQFELGAVPPFGGPSGDTVVIDRRLAEIDHVVFDAGVHDTSLRLRTEDLLTVADARLADIAAG